MPRLLAPHFYMPLDMTCMDRHNARSPSFHSSNMIAKTAPPSTQVLSVYSREENIGEELLSRVFMGRYRSDGYVWHVAVKVRRLDVHRLQSRLSVYVAARALRATWMIKRGKWLRRPRGQFLQEPWEVDCSRPDSGITTSD